MGRTAVSARGEVVCSVNVPNGILAYHTRQALCFLLDREAVDRRRLSHAEAASPMAGLSRSSTASASAHGAGKAWLEQRSSAYGRFDTLAR